MSQPNQPENNEGLVFILGEIKGQLTSLTTVIGSIQDHQQAMETRLRTLENAWAKLLGASAAAGALAGFIIDVVLK